LKEVQLCLVAEIQGQLQEIELCLVAQKLKGKLIAKTAQFVWLQRHTT